MSFSSTSPSLRQLLNHGDDLVQNRFRNSSEMQQRITIDSVHEISRLYLNVIEKRMRLKYFIQRWFTDPRFAVTKKAYGAIDALRDLAKQDIEQKLFGDIDSNIARNNMENQPFLNSINDKLKTVSNKLSAFHVGCIAFLEEGENGTGMIPQLNNYGNSLKHALNDASFILKMAKTKGKSRKHGKRRVLGNKNERQKPSQDCDEINLSLISIMESDAMNMTLDILNFFRDWPQNELMKIHPTSHENGSTSSETIEAIILANATDSLNNILAHFVRKTVGMRKCLYKNVEILKDIKHWLDTLNLKKEMYYGFDFSEFTTLFDTENEKLSTYFNQYTRNESSKYLLFQQIAGDFSNSFQLLTDRINTAIHQNALLPIPPLVDATHETIYTTYVKGLTYFNDMSIVLSEDDNFTDTARSLKIWMKPIPSDRNSEVDYYVTHVQPMDIFVNVLGQLAVHGYIYMYCYGDIPQIDFCSD